MILARFGDDWHTAYRLSDLRHETAFAIARPPAVEQAGGSDGAIDFFGDDPYPLAPRTLSKRFNLRGRTSLEISPLLDELILNTVGRGRSKLWAVTRDQQVRRWAWAKCIGLDYTEASGQNFMSLPVTATFSLSEGVWYGEQRVGAFSNIAYGSDITLLNNGVLPAIPILQVDIASPGRLIGFRIRDNSDYAIETSLNSAFFNEDPSLRAVRMLIDCVSYTSQYWVNDTSDPPVNGYSRMTIGVVNIPWFQLRPGSSTYRVWYERTDSSPVTLTVSRHERFL